MEESIRNAEKLIAAANTTLAQMKYDAIYDDFGYVDKDVDRRNKEGSQEELLASFLGTGGKAPTSSLSFDRKHSSHDSSIEEINNKIEAYRQELLEKEQRKSLRAWHLNRNELEMSRSTERIVPATKTASDTNLSQKSVTKIKHLTVTEDLKSKLLKTQEIVDRGIQTAREISETVHVFKNKPMKTERFDNVSVSKSRSSEKLGKSESKSTIKSADIKRCKKCNGEIGEKKGVRQKVNRNVENVLITVIRGRDEKPKKFRKLNFQQLPSLNIQGDLICQKIPSVDILPGKRDCFPVRTNTALETYSHEQILNNKIRRVIDDIKKWNSFVKSENFTKAGTIECSNCGLAIKARNSFIDCEKIDELLKICDYDVFDPRIDEFVERVSVKKEEEAKSTQTEKEPTLEMEEPKGLPQSKQVVAKENETNVKKDESPKKPKISALSKEVTRKYRQKAAELESNHLEFESIIRDLFGKIDESRDLFKSYDYLDTIMRDEKRKASLTVTTPVLLSYTGNVEEIDDGNNAVIRPKRPQRHKMSSKEIRKKLEKKELRTNCKLLTSTHSWKNHDRERNESADAEQLLISRKSKKELENRLKVSAENTKTSNLREDTSAKEPIIGLSQPKPSLSPEAIFVAEESVKHTNTESDYESDFEEESYDELPVAAENYAEDVRSMKLSTITEVDSEVKVSSVLQEVTEEEIEGSPKTVPEAPPEPDDLNEVKLDRNQTSSSTSSEDNTRKLLKQVNRDLEEVVSLSTRREKAVNISDQLTEPLKEVLDALKNQFERTELLADILTESIKEVNEVKEERRENCDKPETVMMKNLQKTRKNFEKYKISPRSDLLDSLHAKSPKDSTSSGEVVGDYDRSHSLGLRNIKDLPICRPSSANKLYSEGEVSELEVSASEGSSPSVGEVINGSYSDGLLSEENSVLRFF